ncbi:DNA-binding transcriptional regulator SgrR of sgrS sRNA, contains a MarR-type HTH domain and a solute-binding domain [Evansella caseinilytica]|uniref:DNA-binding transcriptional regulator SgrR of sgrS sRNA, contains a MarR-type HTH domain and a solute-binding domain n=1 Tax=Evansella caseinilytica TaxID=1503961 RepID=A0A1H3U890_9BACI|nr:SgrR family transcriptional regulator [Evansella caseinilytica]SDZ58646.1 DNA-binding transcriptional regulator SgrR of sgrS sRNA, contains a MarR-type HTH domain and a solute-binding domain [Evansella caseinilytica]
MKLLEHYDVLVRELGPSGQELPITVAEMAALLSCSQRNVKLIIRKLQERGWIQWKPGKGRGNRSTIVLNKNIDTLIIEEAKRRMTPASIDESMQLLKKYQVQPSVQREYIDWIFHSYLGKQREKTTDELSRLHFPSYRPLPVLDPRDVCRRSENHIMRHIYNQLVTYDKETNTYLPQLAHQWEHNADYTMWRFYLQKGVRFHHGREMAAEDVCYSFRRHRETPSAYRWIVEDWKKAVTVNTFTVDIHFTKPCPFLLSLAASLGGSIVPEEHHDRQQLPIGTGPFRVKENSKNKLLLEVFKDYFLRRPFLDEVIIYFFPKLYDNPAAGSPSYEDQMNFYHYPYSGSRLEQLETYTKVDRGSKLLTLNRKSGILADDAMLRKAIFHFLSPEKMIAELGGTRFSTASRLLAESERENAVRSKSIGRSCLKNSSYAGEPLTLFSYAGAGNEADGKWIQKELKREGIDVVLTFFPYEELLRLPLSVKADMLLGEQLTDDNVWYTYMSALTGNHSLLAHHLPGETEAEIAAKSQAGENETDTAAALRKIEARLVQAHSFIHLYRIKQFAFYPSYVRGVQMNPLGWVDYTKLWYQS